jgi:hypothetical protein
MKTQVYLQSAAELMGVILVTADHSGRARSKTWTVFARSNTVIVGSSPTRGMDVCVRLFCFVLFCV